MVAQALSSTSSGDEAAGGSSPTRRRPRPNRLELATKRLLGAMGAGGDARREAKPRGGSDADDKLWGLFLCLV